jgi:hypothetical protein
MSSDYISKFVFLLERKVSPQATIMKASSIFGRQSLLMAALALSVSAQPKPNLVNTVEKGVNTECKTCPWTLCTNKAFYEGGDNVTLTCWTHGTEIAGDRYSLTLPFQQQF